MPAIALFLSLLQSEDQIRGWIRDLGADDFDARETAARSLMQAGPEALPLVREAAASADLEISVRARQIAAHLQWSSYFLPHESRELIAMARAASAGDPAARAQAIGELFTRAAPAALVMKYSGDPDPTVKNAARWSALRCPDRAVAHIALDLLRENANNRGSLAALISEPYFFELLDATQADELRKIADGPADAALVARLALARIDGGGLPPEVGALITNDDVWFANQIVAYLRRYGGPDDVADLEPLLDRGDVEYYVAQNAISDLGGPHAKQIYTDRLKKLVESGAGDDNGLMVEAGHVEATEAMPYVVKLFEAGVAISSAGHALSDMEWTDGADAMLASVKSGNSLSTSYLANVGGPKITAAAYAAWRKQAEGEALDAFESQMLSIRPALNLADRAPEAILLLADADAPVALRAEALDELAGHRLPPDSDQALRDTLDAILSGPAGKLTDDAADAAAFLGMRYRPEWTTIVRDAGSADGLRRAADLRYAEAADHARDELESGSPDRREAALYYLGRAGTPDALRAALHKHAAGQPLAALDAAAASGDAEAIRLACDAPLPADAIETLARLEGDAPTAALRRFVESGPADARLRAMLALHRRDPASVPEPARTLVLLPDPWDEHFAADARWKTPRADVVAALRRVFDPDAAELATRSMDGLDPAQIADLRQREVRGALRGLGRLGDASSQSLLTRYLRDGGPTFSGTAADALVDLLGADTALPILREAAAATVEDDPILHAMARAGDAAALRTLVARVPTQDNHYVTGQFQLRELDRLVNADRYETARVRRALTLERETWGRLLERLERDHGVRLEISPGLSALKTVYDTVSLSGAYDLLSALSVKPDKWDSFVVHVHKGDHVLLCTPVEAKAYWEERVRQ